MTGASTCKAGPQGDRVALKANEINKVCTARLARCYTSYHILGSAVAAEQHLQRTDDLRRFCILVAYGVFLLINLDLGSPLNVFGGAHCWCRLGLSLNFSVADFLFR